MCNLSEGLLTGSIAELAKFIFHTSLDGIQLNRQYLNRWFVMRTRAITFYLTYLKTAFAGFGNLIFWHFKKCHFTRAAHW